MIKNLLFDLGGVIMDIRRENCVEAFERLGMKDADSFLGVYAQSGPFEAIENGSATPGEFRTQVRRVIGRDDITDEQIDTAFQKFLLGIPPERLKHLDELHKRFRIYMLSNTNPIMWHGDIARYFARSGHPVEYYFDGVLRSYKAGVMKPKPEIFLMARDIFGIKPEETIFLDDSQSNCDAAAALGFKTICVKPGTEFMDLLDKFTPQDA